MKKIHVIIVGGGASGLVAAITAAREGANVTIVEQKDRVGKKILSTGNGRCNLTNEYMESHCFHGDDITIVSEILRQFGYQETLAFFEELGVLLKSRQGYIYPISDQAGTILDVFCMGIKRLGIQVLLGETVTKISKTNKGFTVQTMKGTVIGDAVVLATGGKAAPALGSDGSGYTLAKSFGHKLSPVVPALVQLKGNGNYFKQISGVRTQAKVSLYAEGVFMCEDIGELQLTNYGISGIPVFQVSRYAAKALYEKKSVIAELDYLPTMSDDEFHTFFIHRLELPGEKHAEDFLIGVFHKKLIPVLLKTAGSPLQISMNDVKEAKLTKLVEICKHFQVEITDTNGFDQAQVCAGGVRVAEINPHTVESIYAEHLYLTGELLDIDGICGRYNLQWAWSTGYIAGKHAVKGHSYDSNRSIKTTTEPYRKRFITKTC